MNNDKLNLIKEELKTAGASEGEADELAYFSKNLSNAVSIERSLETKYRILEKIKISNQGLSKNDYFKYRPLFASVLGVILLLGFATFVSAQDSVPGQPLYPVKRITESVVSTVNPSFNAEILKRRSEEIKTLTKPSNKTNDSAQNLKNTLRDYENELRGHTDIDSKDIDESKINLEDAKEHSSQEDRQQIEDALKRVESQNEEVKGDSITPTETFSKDRESDSFENSTKR